MNYCGIDFGTSNSTVGLVTPQGNPYLVKLEKEKTTLPTAVFFNYELGKTSFGREATDEYLAGYAGRFLRSLKSVLGTTLMDEKQTIQGVPMSFLQIIGVFIAELKKRAEREQGKELDAVVLGRPVYFVDNNKSLDNAVEADIARMVGFLGFKNVAFQYEPIAAALAYEQSVKKEELALIIDIGGGTSDFSLIRLYPGGNSRNDRGKDILANHGIHVGGTDFDKKLSLQSVMPHLGLGAALIENDLAEMPVHYYQDLASWHKIHLMYDRTVMAQIKNFLSRVRNPRLVERLVDVLEKKAGHQIAIQVEEAKINLTRQPEVTINLNFIEQTLSSLVSEPELNESIHDYTTSIENEIEHTVKLAGINKSQISTVFLTGGSTAIPVLQKSFATIFPEAGIIQGDLFGSVGMGLALEAGNRFR